MTISRRQLLGAASVAEVARWSAASAAATLPAPDGVPDHTSVLRRLSTSLGIGMPR